LPDDVIVYFTSHTDTDTDGNTKIKTIGNALDKYIAVEGLFMIVLGTVVVNDSYYFATQNSGNDTLKSPDGMFPSKWIPNDLKYVGDKIRNYYYMDGAKTDEEMASVDAEHTVEDSEVKPERKSRRKATGDTEPPKTVRTRRSRDEVQESNEKKMDEYQKACDAAVEEKFGDREEIEFGEYCEATKDIPQPETEKLPRRTRKERKSTTDAAPVEPTEPAPTEGFMNNPEPVQSESATRTRRTRRTRS
jgi:hypothetical protein